MGQRYDLLAISFLMLTVVFTVWLLALSVDGMHATILAIQGWQTLIGSFVTALGVLVAAWNVTRQMQLAARGREQDRIEKELPGLRAAVFLLTGISLAINRKIDGERVLTALAERGFKKPTVGDFIDHAAAALPLTTDYTRRDLAIELFRLHVSATRFVQKRDELAEAQSVLGIRTRLNQDKAHAEDQVREEEEAFAIVAEQLSEAIGYFEAYREELVELGKAEVKRQTVLRREHEKKLGLPH